MTQFRQYFSIVSNPLAIHLVGWGSYFALVWSRQLSFTSNGLTAGSIATWADGALHLSLISSFGYVSLWPTTLPVYLNQPLTYPFVADWLAGLLVRLGMPLTVAYTYLGLILSLVFIYLLFRFFEGFLNSAKAALVSSFIFLCSGGLGFLMLAGEVVGGKLPMAELIESDFTHQPERYIGWINLVVSEFLPQRAFLLGISVGLVLLMFAWRTITSKLPLRWWFGAGVLFGLLPIIHPHTMLALSPLIGLMLVRFLVVYKKMGPVLMFVITSLVVALPLMAVFILRGEALNQIVYYPGWLARTYGANWFYFWLINWGVLPVVSLVGMRFMSWRQRLFVLPFVGLFVVSNLFLFQVYDWDNTKLLTWVYLVMAAPAGLLVVKLWGRDWKYKLMAGILLVLTCVSGWMDIGRVLDYSRQSIPMFSAADLEVADWIRLNTAVDAVFLTASNHNHPVPVLTGRQIVMGYPGWLWSYGIDYGERQLEVRQIYMGDEFADVHLTKLEPDYIVVGPAERQQFQPNMEYLGSVGEVVFNSDLYTVLTLN